jgi:hypothetical protein
MTFWQWRERAHCLRAIPLEAVLRACGARSDPEDQRKWHTPQGVLSITGAKFMNWNRGMGGGGAIDLAIHLNNLDFKGALDWLERHFPGPITPEPTSPLARSQFKLPPPDPSSLARVRRYLVAQRGIAPSLIDSLVRSGILYADPKANAVFLLLGKQNNPVGAELRGTTPGRWHGLAPGSQKDLGFFSIPLVPLPEMILCESAIDAISCFLLHPQYRCISTAGARPNPRWLAALLAQGPRVFCGFDADATGDNMARAMITLYPSIKRLRPSHHDWNDLLTSRA